MLLNLQGKTALVTGGARGIGLAVAQRLLEAGARVAICSTRKETLQPALDSLGPLAVGEVCDVRDDKQVEKLFGFLDRTLGGLDILVNNAGVGVFKDLPSLEPAEWERLIGTNLTGVYLCTRQAVPRMRQRGGGFIVNISSLAGKNSFAGGAAYNASKFGLNGMSEAIMLDHRYESVRVSTVLPGSVNTEFGRSGPADWKIQPEDVAEVVAMILALPERTLVSHVEIRPSRPPRK
jgi:NAD(P)-dependent dehydrogenase (short-subunit alcohol dehydrogenase family)